MDLRARKNIRLRGYDYSQNGAYFITVCTQHRQHTLARIVGQGLCSCQNQNDKPTTVGQGLCSCITCKSVLSPIGKIVQNELNKIPERYPRVKLDKFVIMPNHVHAIISICNNSDAIQQTQERQEQSPCPTVGDIICAFKSITTKTANNADETPGRKIWQFRFHDHIIRNDEEYNKIWQYIDENPMKWQDDCYYE